jgi:hypothetical protein
LILYGWRISDLLVLGIIAGGGIYYAASTGMLNNILPPPPPQQQQYVKSITNRSFSREDDMIEDIQDEINKGKKKELYNLIL